MTQQDYSFSQSPKPAQKRRVVFLGLICAACMGALYVSNSTATRNLMGASDLSASTAVNASLRNGSAFDQAIQGPASDNLPVPTASAWLSYTIKSGDTLSSILAGAGVTNNEWHALMLRDREAAPLKKLQIGRSLRLLKNADDEIDELAYEYDETHTLQVHRVNDQLEVTTLEAALEHRSTTASGRITSSLFADGHKAGLTDRMIMQMTSLFGYDIDFALDLKEGDRFSVVYDTLYKDGKRLRDGEILAAEFVNNGKTYRSLRYQFPDGSTAYYTPEGQSFRKAFTRTPVDFTRISSGFNLHRMHPILNIVRAHKGVDYAAAMGTPVKATGDGSVTFLGVKRGYGNVIVLRHGAHYETLYGHMSRFRKGLRSGMKVKQGQVIGYVGMTGLATAPHLHYEFHVDGVYRNPITVALPRANSLSRKQAMEWRVKNAAILAQLDGISTEQIAQIGANRSTAVR